MRYTEAYIFNICGMLIWSNSDLLASVSSSDFKTQGETSCLNEFLVVEFMCYNLRNYVFSKCKRSCVFSQKLSGRPINK